MHIFDICYAFLWTLISLGFKIQAQMRTMHEWRSIELGHLQGPHIQGTLSWEFGYDLHRYFGFWFWFLGVCVCVKNFPGRRISETVNCYSILRLHAFWQTSWYKNYTFKKIWPQIFMYNIKILQICRSSSDWEKKSNDCLLPVAKGDSRSYPHYSASSFLLAASYW